jgi:hypothetical protein
MTSESPRPRWTARRVRATALHTAVGLLIGLGLTPMTIGFGAAIMRPFGPMAMLGILAFATFVVAHSTRGTCTRHPAAPQGIAAGLGIGAAASLALVLAFFGRVPLTAQLSGLVLLITFPAAAYYAGKRTLASYLGEIRRGVGLTCAACGYDLSATPENWPCPECGGEMRYERRPEADS